MTRPQSAPAPDISLIICTYNRADLLALALESACRQAVHPSRYEIIVVDNNSTDHTRDVVSRYQRHFQPDHITIRYLQETRIGLSHARNRGWQEARAPYIAYTDDDCILPSHWLAVALEIIVAHGPEALGGPYRAFFLTPKPAWYKDSYGSGGFGAETRTLHTGEYLAGNNMVFDRAILAKLGGFDPRHGMTGTHVGYGEDNEIQMRLRQLCPDVTIRYDPRLELLHLVRREQMTLRWMARAAIARGRYQYWLSDSSAMGPRRIAWECAKLSKTLAVSAYDSAKGLVVRDRSRYPQYANFLRESVLWRLRAIGRLQAGIYHAMHATDPAHDATS